MTRGELKNYGYRRDTASGPRLYQAMFGISLASRLYKYAKAHDASVASVVRAAVTDFLSRFE